VICVRNQVNESWLLELNLGDLGLNFHVTEKYSVRYETCTRTRPRPHKCLLSAWAVFLKQLVQVARDAFRSDEVAFRQRTWFIVPEARRGLT
jgi:hypothetical protein